jgi:hypothetical protein
MAPPKSGPSQFLSQGPSVPWAHRRPGYPLSGCVPAVFDPEAQTRREPDSVSPGKKRLPEEGRRFKCPGTPEPCLENPSRRRSIALATERGFDGLVPRNLSWRPRMVGMASPANVTPWKERGLCTIKASDNPQILRTSQIISTGQGPGASEVHLQKKRARAAPGMSEEWWATERRCA